MAKLKIIILSLACCICMSTTALADNTMGELINGNTDALYDIRAGDNTVYNKPIMDIAMSGILNEQTAITAFDILKDNGFKPTYTTFLNALYPYKYNLFSQYDRFLTYNSKITKSTDYIKLKMIYDTMEDKDSLEIPYIVKYTFADAPDIMIKSISEMILNSDLNYAACLTAAFGKPKNMQVLIDKYDVSPTQTDSDGNSLYFIAAKYNNCNMLEMLEYEGAIKDYSIDDKRRLISFALDYNAEPTLKYLLVNGLVTEDMVENERKYRKNITEEENE